MEWKLTDEEIERVAGQRGSCGEYDIFDLEAVAEAQAKKLVERIESKGRPYHKQQGVYQTFGIDMDVWLELRRQAGL